MKGAIITDITTIKYPSHNDLVQWYYQLAQDIAEAAGVTPEAVNALIAAYIEEHPYPVVPANVITGDNIADNAVTSFNGAKGSVTGVTSVNGMSGTTVQTGWYTGDGGGHLLTFASDAAIFIAEISVQCVSQFPPQYEGVMPNPGYMNVARLIGAQFLTDPTPFVPSSVHLKTNEGAWTIVITGIASGKQVTIGDKKNACITAIITGLNNVLYREYE